MVTYHQTYPTGGLLTAGSPTMRCMGLTPPLKSFDLDRPGHLTPINYLSMAAQHHAPGITRAADGVDRRSMQSARLEKPLPFPAYLLFSLFPLKITRWGRVHRCLLWSILAIMVDEWLIAGVFWSIVNHSDPFLRIVIVIER